MNYNLIFIIAGILFFGCDHADDRLVLFNETDDTIYFSKTTNTYQSLFSESYDSAMISQSYLNYVKSIPPHSKQKQLILGNWENQIKEIDSFGNLQVYTFDITVLKKYKWKQIISEKKYRSKQVFNEKGLKKNNWEVVLDK